MGVKFFRGFGQMCTDVGMYSSAGLTRRSDEDENDVNHMLWSSQSPDHNPADSTDVSFN